ncbi:MAG: MFS transporter [Pirellulales bacterium]|nr:MFS transporter [Pirellulales bacterium]
MEVNATYITLSLMMFFEYAVWGAWMPVLAARLLGPLGMNGKQTGWIYATLPLATMFAPLVAGPLADQSIDARWILVVAHAVGAVLLLLAVTQRKFAGLFIVMLLYSACYGATIPLVNAVMFRHLEAAGVDSSKIFIWAPVAWALVGYALTGWRAMRKSEGDGSDCLLFAAVLSVVMAAVCAFQPATAPEAGAGGAMGKALAMLQDVPFLIFILASLVVSGMMQFYFLGTAQFMQDIGLKSKYVPGAMAIAQAVQALATWFLLSHFFFNAPGPKWTLVVGAGCWMLLFAVYTFVKIPGVVVLAQPLHGLAYVFFIIAGQMFINEVADPAIVASAQSLIILVTTGIGLFLGTQLAGVVMDWSSVGGKFQWSKVFIVPALCTLVGVIALAVGVTDPPKKAPAVNPPAVQQEAGPDKVG